MKPDKKYIWDYDLESIDLRKKAVLRWYLSRKINFGDWGSLKSKLVEKNLDYLEIDPTLKQMLKKYYVFKRTKNNS
ncbi:hypothetical protein KJ713_03445 [Patescibacteria group bacterium]|nr:hypothetical protein [Patescibacteria group bacterium]